MYAQFFKNTIMVLKKGFDVIAGLFEIGAGTSVLLLWEFI
jgi:hypothetical protein